MNMKKTIAAVAACAMAVSAMATTVSAVSEGAEVGQSVKYNLTMTTETKEANLNFKVTGFDVTTGSVTGIAVIVDTTVVKDFDDVVTVTYKPTSDGTNPVNDGQTKTFTFTTNKDSADYDGTSKKLECGTEDATKKKVVSAGKEAYFIDFTTTKAGAELAAAMALPGDLTVSVKLKDSKVDQKGLSAEIDKDNDNAQTPNDYDRAMRVAAVTNTAGTNNPVVKVGDKEWFVDTDATATGATWGGIPAAKQLAETGYDFTLRGAVNKNTKVDYMPSDSNVKSDPVNVPEIFNRLNTPGSRGVNKKYDNAKAVINDMIANYDEVTFTFNTAKEKVNNVDYSVFPQQLYNLFGDEETKYVYAAEPTYEFHNLFNAALVANNDLTMNQSSIAPLVFNKSSVVFEWNTMKNTDLVVSPAAALQTLQLATSSRWYWESMEVTGYNVSTEDTESQAPIPADEEDLDDTDAEIDDTDAADDEIDDTDDADADADTDTGDVDDTDDADADDTTDEGDAAADEGNAAADETTGNPETGNAPIALAVIPVALAAAAVVAKKRG